MRKLDCLRCGSGMTFLMQEKFQKGDMGPWVGNINFSMQRGFEMEVYSCPKCGKLEFYLPGVSEKEEPAEIEFEELPPDPDRPIVGVSKDGIPLVRCPACGRNHDFDYPRCPHCDYEYK